MSNKSRMKNKDRINTKVSPMPPEVKKQFLPYTVVKLVTGAQIIPNFQMKKDIVAIHWNNEAEFIHQEDYELAKKVADEIWEQTVKAKNLFPSLSTIPIGIMIHRTAAEKIKTLVDGGPAAGKKKVMFIKDTSGCGYWRMTVPSRYINLDKYYWDMCEAEVTYEYLLEYEVIVVQRLHQWREFYTIERLKRMGRKIIYDIDDDIFNIPSHNPASRLIRNDECEAARCIMRLADKITVTTEILKNKLGFPEKTVIIPNAIDLDDGYPTGWQGSPDEFKRIVWMGSATHHEDWTECFDAVDELFRQRKDVRLLIMGMLPNVVRKNVEDATKPYWDNRVEFMDFKDVETYVSLTKNFKADIAIAPLQSTPFNSCKSAIKWQEYTAAGLPTIASDCSPYKEAITNGIDGFLVNGKDAWLAAMKMLLDDKELCKITVENARRTINEKLDVKKVVELWEKTLFEPQLQVIQGGAS